MTRAADETGSVVRRAHRDAAVVTALLAAAIYAGSERFAHFDPALTGYCLATIVTCFAVTYQVAVFWRRRPSAFYGRALLSAVRRPRRLLVVLRGAGRNVGAQRFILPRSRARWLAHMLLSWGTLVGFAVTLPLVWGWVHFEAEDNHHYRAVVFSIRGARFATDGVFAWLVFHALLLAAAAVILGAGYFLVRRLRARREAGALGAVHVAPLLLLLAVALTGLALPVCGHVGSPRLWWAATTAHEAAVVLLLVALPYGKLIHLFIRPLQLGAQLVRAASHAAACVECGAALAPAAQLAAVEAMLAASGRSFDGHPRRCPACRRRQLAATQAILLGAQFQPPMSVRRARLQRAA